MLVSHLRTRRLRRVYGEKRPADQHTKGKFDHKVLSDMTCPINSSVVVLHSVMGYCEFEGDTAHIRN